MQKHLLGEFSQTQSLSPSRRRGDDPEVGEQLALRPNDLQDEVGLGVDLAERRDAAADLRRPSSRKRSCSTSTELASISHVTPDAFEASSIIRHQWMLTAGPERRPVMKPLFPRSTLRAEGQWPARPGCGRNLSVSSLRLRPRADDAVAGSAPVACRRCRLSAPIR